MRVGVREQRSKEERLRDDFGIRVAGVPRLNHVYTQQAGRCCRRDRADQTVRDEVHGNDTENGPPGNDLPRSRDAVQAIRDGDPDRISLWKLPADGACFRIAQMKAHVADAVKAFVAVIREKQVARFRGYAGGNRIDGDERSPLGYLDALAHIHARVAASEHVLCRRDCEVHPRADSQ